MKIDAFPFAQELFDAKEYGACEMLMSRYTQENALDVSAKLLLGNVYEQIHRPDLAMQNYEIGIQIAAATDQDASPLEHALEHLRQKKVEAPGLQDQAPSNEKRILGTPEAKGREVVGPQTLHGKKTAVLLTAGQSNAANAGDVSFVPDGDVFNLNIHDGLLYRARDPLLGCTSTGGNVATRLGQILTTADGWDTAVLVPVAVSGSPIADWVPGKPYFERLVAAADCLGEFQLTPMAILWQQGETDTMRGTTPDDFKRCFLEVVTGLRSIGIAAPVHVAVSTFGMGGDYVAMRAALRSLVDPENSILPGPDTDDLGIPYRYDSCHFSDRGMWEAAHMWADCLRPFHRPVFEDPAPERDIQELQVPQYEH